jgi:Spy/CpxP family protein refolding chaperone
VEEIHRRHYQETAQARAELWAKKAELRALLTAETPDEAEVRAVQNEINDLRSSLADKRTEMRLEISKAAPGAGAAGGYGYEYGPRARGGYGPGFCRR